MAKVRLVLRRDSIESLPTSREVRADRERRAQAIVDACNAQSSWGGYVVRNDADSSSIFTIEREADVDNARNNRILRNLDAGAR